MKLGWQEEGVEFEKIATMVFDKIKETVSLYHNEKVSHCCLAVPSHFNAEKAELLQKCCEDAGIKVMRLLKEPCAALIAQNADVSPLFTHKFQHYVVSYT